MKGHTDNKEALLSSYQQLLDRQQEINHRLDEVGISETGPAKRKKGGKNKIVTTTEEIPYTPKTDTHWDFVLKEMMWLGADFQGERKRQVSLAKKCASSVRQFHKTKETRRLRELQQAEMKRRKLAAKIGRDIKGWWTKIEKVVSYKQKLQADEERKKAMNKQLVVLVQQTEKYSESLTKQRGDFYEENSSEYSDEDDTSMDRMESDSSDPSRRRRRKRLTIEEALALERNRKSKNKIIDYSRVRLDDRQFYGESTASDSGSDASFFPESDSDDESTLKKAMDDELLERKNRGLQNRYTSHEQIFQADPDEIRKLHEEIEMDIEMVIERLKEEGVTDIVADTVESRQLDATRTERRVQFQEDIDVKVIPTEEMLDTKSIKSEFTPEDPGNDADDDGDASDVEDYKHSLSDEEDFSDCEPERDDETTIAQEESLPREMSAQEEIDLLKRESEMSVEELRKLYSNLDTPAQSQTPNAETTTEEEEEVEDDSTKEDDEDEFSDCEPERDDETTIEAEERMGREISHEEEMALLEKDNEIPIEQLRAMYASIQNTDEASSDRDRSVESEMDEDSTSQEETKLVDVLEASKSYGNDDDAGEEEFQPNALEMVDDETTIELEEKMGREMSHEEEMALLKKESEIPVEQLRAMYASMEDTLQQSQASNHNETTDNGETKSYFAATGDSDEDAEDYQMNESEAVDDETTIEAEERLGRDMTYEEEMTMLQKENEIPIEQLRAMYQSIYSNNNEETEESENDEDSDNANTTASLFTSANEVEAEHEEYIPGAAEGIDDETTIEAEERLGREISYEDELALLKKENEMSVEELRAMYANIQDVPDEMDLDEEESSEAENISKRGLENEGIDTERGDYKRRRENPSDVDSDDGENALNALEASAERARKTLASRPYLLAYWVNLRKYQQVGLNWLVSLQSRRLNGILADEMGLGKTLQTISLLSYLASYKGIWGPHLIVVPTSVIINWETELKRFCPALKVLTYYGSAKRRKELRIGWTKTNWYHVVITSYQLAVQDAFAFKRKKWYYLVLDEAQNIKNFQSQRWQTLINFNTQRRLLLTGTPLQNSLMELWSLLHFLMPYIFRSRKEFSYWFSNPMNNIIEGNADGNEGVIKKLHGIIRPFVLRRLKKDVETQMPGKFEHIVKCQLSRRQMNLYEEFLSRSSTRKALKKGGNFLGMMNVLMQLRKVCNHPDLFEPRSIITPFVLPGLNNSIPGSIYNATGGNSVIDTLSDNVVQPLWCGSVGLPKIEAALRHNQIEARQLRRLKATLDKRSLISDDESKDCPDELQTLLKEVHAMRQEASDQKIDFHNAVNARRCSSSAFPYSMQLLNAIEIEVDIFQRETPVELRNREIILTPAELLKTRKNRQERASQLDEVIEKFVFCVPRASARFPVLDSTGSSALGFSSKDMKEAEEELLQPLEEYLKPSRRAHARLSSFFPDKKFIQYDAGKLQTLAELLRKLKQGGHRCLIFTQMSKMLDILEAFLNIHGHTYLRLDGSTGVDRRQRYMDRFNNDAKLFCFILSTRSGGMGINLTGADTVIFYDSDWNPAMDAQAQDRAHRIGQTREVHIYRLITEHTIEENILMKAKQKRNLDIMVMDQGKFDASQQVHGSEGDANQIKDVYTKGGLRAILGVVDDDDKTEVKESADLSNEQMEKAMASLEDEDDAQALRGAQKEAAEELKEFDENAVIEKDPDAEDEENDDGEESDKRPSKRQKANNSKQDKEEKGSENVEEQKSEENELEKEFASWQNTVGFDASAIDNALSPMERYALAFREDIDPFYSIFYINELNRKLEVAENQEDIDIEAIEREKASEERLAMELGDLLATRPHPENLVRQRNLYQRERSRLRADKKRRQLTGESWSSKIDGTTQKPFWYNSDTGEAIWNKPTLLVELEANDLAVEKGWGFLPTKPLVEIISFLVPLPDRQSCSYVCRQWRAAANDTRFVRHVYPVEMGALTRIGDKRHHNHYNTIAEALSIALPGDTIELADGHYWVDSPGLLIDKPIKLVGDENNAANVVIEMSGSVEWKARRGWIEGITFRRPKISTGLPVSLPMLKMTDEANVDMFRCVFDNDSSSGPVTTLSGTGSKGRWTDVVVRNGGSHGITMTGEITVELINSSIKANKENGVHCSDKAKIKLVKTKVTKNLGFGLECKSGCGGEIQKCAFSGNKKGVICKETGCTFTCSGNTALVYALPKKNIPGFKITRITAAMDEGMNGA